MTRISRGLGRTRHGVARACSRPRVVVAGAVVAALVVGGVGVRLATSSGGPGGTDRSAQQAAGRLEGCGPLAVSEVHGTRPRYLPKRLSWFWGNETVCRGMWLSGRKGRLVPQGLAVAGRVGWVTGYDGSAPRSQRACKLLKIDLRHLEVVAVQPRIVGSVPGRPPTYCRHGGAVVADGPTRLWVVETRRLWLLDPRLVGRPDAVRRVWRLEGGVRGSVGVLVPGKGLGLGRHVVGGRGRIDWFDTRRIRRSAKGILGASSTEHAPRGLQGLTYGRLGSRGASGLWLTMSNGGCGVLIGPRGQRLPALPGAEGLAFDGRGGLWMLSEASVARYYDRGDAVVPQLVRYSTENLADRFGLKGGERRVRRCLS